MDGGCDPSGPERRAARSGGHAPGPWRAMQHRVAPLVPRPRPPSYCWDTEALRGNDSPEMGRGLVSELESPPSAAWVSLGHAVEWQSSMIEGKGHEIQFDW